MSAAEIIAEIQALPREEQLRVAEYVSRELLVTTEAPPKAAMSFEDAAAEVFTEYRDLLSRLAK